jgi:hypothetical protein
MKRSHDLVADVSATKLAEWEFEDSGELPWGASALGCLINWSVFQMFLNLSPLAAHLNESLTSLRFATKVSRVLIRSAFFTDLTVFRR